MISRCKHRQESAKTKVRAQRYIASFRRIERRPALQQAATIEIIDVADAERVEETQRASSPAIQRKFFLGEFHLPHASKTTSPSFRAVTARAARELAGLNSEIRGCIMALGKGSMSAELDDARKRNSVDRESRSNSLLISTRRLRSSRRPCPH
jgi:hypothetical protein